jgi:hypothetical protein
MGFKIEQMRISNKGRRGVIKTHCMHVWKCHKEPCYNVQLTYTNTKIFHKRMYKKKKIQNSYKQDHAKEVTEGSAKQKRRTSPKRAKPGEGPPS